MQAFHGVDGTAIENDLVAHRLHTKYPNVLFHQHWHDLVLETAKMGIHQIQGHLDGVKSSTVFIPNLQHP